MVADVSSSNQHIGFLVSAFLTSASKFSVMSKCGVKKVYNNSSVVALQINLSNDF